jgi:hypothetical protein
MPAWTDTHDETDPADTDLISDGAREMRQDIKRIFRERLNNLLTDGDAPVPAATLANTDTRIGPGSGGLGAPGAESAGDKMISGDRVDLRGCPWRLSTLTTDASIRATAAASITWSPIGNPGGAEGTGTFAITRTPVSTASLYLCILTCAVAGSGGATDAHRGELRIKNTTTGAALTPIWLTRSSSISTATLMALFSSPSGANRFEPQFVTGGGAGIVFTVHGDITPSHFRIIELV